MTVCNVSIDDISFSRNPAETGEIIIVNITIVPTQIRISTDDGSVLTDIEGNHHLLIFLFV